MSTALLPIVEAALAAHDITYNVFECDPALADTAAFCERYGFALEQSANTIIVASKTDPAQYACCVVLATTKLDVNKTVCKLLGVRKASFAPMDAALELTGMEYGGVTAFGVPAELPIYVDAAVMEQAEVVMGGGNRSSKVLVRPAELTKIPNLQVVDGLAKPVTTAS
jgi:prolyl-tRNA editing enzyme YbaK/EbsC (Cys-tRNA(Pro) deacylase)